MKNKILGFLGIVIGVIVALIALALPISLTIYVLTFDVFYSNISMICVIWLTVASFLFWIGTRK